MFEFFEHFYCSPLFISDYLIKKEKPIQDEWDKLKAERKARLAKEWADYSDRTLNTFLIMINRLTLYLSFSGPKIIFVCCLLQTQLFQYLPQKFHRLQYDPFITRLIVI